MCEQTVPGAAPDGGDALWQTDRGNLRCKIEPGGTGGTSDIRHCTAAGKLRRVCLLTGQGCIV